MCFSNRKQVHITGIDKWHSMSAVSWKVIDVTYKKQGFHNRALEHPPLYPFWGQVMTFHDNLLNMTSSIRLNPRGTITAEAQQSQLAINVS